MYEFLITNLRNCAETNSLSRYKRELMKQAADAIEELQKAVLRLEEASGILDELPMVDQREPPKEE